jgi:NMD protein affecting ribosome stability and mRNA decay
MKHELPCNDCGKPCHCEDGVCPECAKKEEDLRVMEVQSALDGSNGIIYPE